MPVRGVGKDGKSWETAALRVLVIRKFLNLKFSRSFSGRIEKGVIKTTRTEFA